MIEKYYIHYGPKQLYASVASRADFLNEQKKNMSIPGEMVHYINIFSRSDFIIINWIEDI